MTLIVRPGFAYDTDASNYIDAVEAADQADTPGIGAMETGVRYAINNFVIGCKQDGIWSAIKASCILAGARTLSGALVPLVGTAPTNNGPFVSGDYNRKTGLGNNPNTSKYLNSNFIETQNNMHLSVYASTATNAYYAGTTYTINDAHFTAIRQSSTAFAYNQNGGTIARLGPSGTTGFLATARNSSSTCLARGGKITTTATAISYSPGGNQVFIFSAVSVGNREYSLSKIAFYSAGDFLDLALLDGRVTDLITAIGAAIP